MNTTIEEFHNPQNLTPEQFGGPDGFRLITVEEMAVLSDPEGFSSELGQKLLGALMLQFFSQGSCRWELVPRFKGMNKLDGTFTYRTASPLPTMASAPYDPVYPTDFEAACADFVESFKFIADVHHRIMVSKGFWAAEHGVVKAMRESGLQQYIPTVIAAFDGQKIALQTTEASEALEGLRHGNPPDDKIPEFSAAEAEFADVILRLMDQAHARGWNVAGALVAKIKMNATRDKMHGGKQF